MKSRFFVVVAVLLAASLDVACGSFVEANAAYLSGDFYEAAEIGESVITQGEWTPEVFYNLGNAYFRMKEPGLAALNYQRALFLNPQFAEARLNLDVVLQGARQGSGARHWSTAFFGGLSANQFAVLASALGWAALGCFVIWAFFRHKLKWLMAGFVLLPAFAFCLSGAFFSPLRMPDADAAMVIRDGVAARFAPADTATLVSALPLGSPVNVLSEAGAWIYVELPDERRGWIQAGGIQRLIPGLDEAG